jgi:predicted amidophosphoribosyltransferase
VVDTDLVSINVDGETRRLLTISAFVHKDVSPSNLTSLKNADWEGVDEMVEHATSYISNALQMHHFDWVVPVPSSRPLAMKFAKSLAGKIGATLIDDVFSKLKHGVDNVEIKHVGTGHWDRFRTQKFQMVDKNIIRYRRGRYLIADDVSTTQSSLVEIAHDLYSAGAEFVGAATLTMQG